MRPLIIFLAIIALAACKDQTERTQKEIKEGENKERITKKKVEEAYKQGDPAKRESYP